MKKRLSAVLAVVSLFGSGLLLRESANAASSGKSFTALATGFTQELVGVVPGFIGGVAFAPDGDPIANSCAGSNGTLHRFDLQAAPLLVRGSSLAPRTTLTSPVGCGMTNHPSGKIYSNTYGGIVVTDQTGALLKGPYGGTSSALGIATDPKTGNLVYAAGGGEIRFVNSELTLSGVFSRVLVGRFIDGVYFEPDGEYLFLADRTTNSVVVMDRAGALVQSVPVPNIPDGIAFHAVAPKFVVTNNLDGSLSRIDFLNNNYSLAAQVSTLGSGGFRGDLTQVGPDTCLYVTQNGTRYDDGSVTSENSLVRICPGFAPPPGVAKLTVEPQTSTEFVDTDHIVTAALKSGSSGGPGSNTRISFKVVSGPNVGATGNCGTNNPNCSTNADGLVSWSYRGREEIGTDSVLVFSDVNTNGVADADEPKVTVSVVWRQFPSVQWANWHTGDVHAHAAGDSGLVGQQYCVDLKNLPAAQAEKACADRNVKRLIQMASANKSEFVFFTEHAPWLGIPNDQLERTANCWNAWDLSSPACVAAFKAYDSVQAARQWAFIRDAASTLSPTTGAPGQRVRALIGEEMGTAPGITCTTIGTSKPNVFTAGHFGVYYTPSLVENTVNTCYEDNFLKPLKAVNGFGGINHPGNTDKGSPWYCYDFWALQPVGYETFDAFLVDARKISAKKSLLFNLTQFSGFIHNNLCSDSISDFASQNAGEGTVRTMEIVSGPHLPNAETLRRWDALLQGGNRIGAVGGGDAHTAPRHFGVGLPFAVAGQDTPNFGKVGLSGRTLAYVQGSIEPAAGYDSNNPSDPIRAAIGAGKTTATNGPSITARVGGDQGTIGTQGDTIDRDSTIAGIPVRVDWDVNAFATIGDTLGDPTLNKEKSVPKPSEAFPASWPAGTLGTSRNDLPSEIRVVVGSREACRVVSSCPAPVTVTVPLTDAIRSRGWVTVNVPFDPSFKSAYVRAEAWYASWPLPHPKDALSNAAFRFGAFTSPIYVEQKTAGSLNGVIRGTNSPIAGVAVSACPGTSYSGCTNPVATGPDGKYNIPSLPNGTWTLVLTPPQSERLVYRATRLDLVTVKGITSFDAVLSPYSPPRPGDLVLNTDGTAVGNVGRGLPTLSPNQSFKIRTNACPNGTVGVSIDLPNRSAGMTEVSPGVYEASFITDQTTPANGTSVPRKGISSITFTITCPGSPVVSRRSFDVYIDPAGDVVDQNGQPVIGATVTILRSDTQRGTYLPVPNGDLVLAPHTPENPEITGTDGRFRWDVAPGWYQVKAEKSGCVDFDQRAQVFALSRPIPVPPPELSLRLVLYCGAIDETPPSLVVTVVGDRTPASPITRVSGPAVTVNFTATDKEDGTASVTCILDEEPPEQCQSPYVLQGLSQEVYHSLTIIATDKFGNTALVAQSIFIQPNQPPVCATATATPSSLWPPNHQMVPISIGGVTDPDGDPVSVTATGVKQDEPTNGLGDGDTAPDATITPGGRASLRSERAGQGDGRVYKISFAASDPKGGTCNGTVTVAVPKNPNSAPVDSGATYDSLLP